MTSSEVALIHCDTYQEENVYRVSKKWIKLPDGVGQFSCIPGAEKKEYQIKQPDVDDFSRMLVDLNLSIGPRGRIMDGIIGMEGNSPRAGGPVRMNVIPRLNNDASRMKLS